MNGIEPYKLEVKEGISIINGLNVSSAVLSLLTDDISNLISLSGVLTGCCSNIMQGNPYHFDSRIAELKGFDGVKEYCSMLRYTHFVLIQIKLDIYQNFITSLFCQYGGVNQRDELNTD